MILISHRGNTNGPSNRENHPDYLLETYNKNHYLEVDIRGIDGLLYLGHDEPEYLIDFDYLAKIHQRTYFHAKNLEALDLLMKYRLKCFFHDKDDHTITSNGYIWTYPEKPVTCMSIIVCQTEEQTIAYSKKVVFGICTDYLNLIGS